MEALEVSQERYVRVMFDNMEKEYVLELNAVQVGMLHGAVRLTLLHPEVRVMSQDFRGMLEHLRSWCRTCLGDMGFLEEEIEYLDTELK